MLEDLRNDAFINTPSRDLGTDPTSNKEKKRKRIVRIYITLTCDVCSPSPTQGYMAMGARGRLSTYFMGGPKVNP